MFQRAISLWQNVRDSLWGLPLAVAAACAAFALFTLNLHLPWATKVAWLYSGSASQAPAFAASLVGAMITLTALAFSITMVVLTLAAQQLGPRLIQIFMRDRGTQFALGLFIGTVIYLLLLLRALDAEAGEAPNLAITGGTALVLASVVTLLFFVHSLARSIVADHVIVQVGASLEDAIIRAFPEAEPESEKSVALQDGGAPVRLDEQGYIERIDYEALARAASEHGIRIRLAYRSGDHVLAGETDAWIFGVCSDDSRKDVMRALRSGVVVAEQRSDGQDPEWSVRQLVEIALRALSPGINDTFTALAAVDRLTLALGRLLSRGEARTAWHDESDVARVFGPAPSFALMLDASFDQIREAASAKRSVLLRLARSLDRLSALAAPRHAEALERHVGLLRREATRSLVEELDRTEVDACLRHARQRLADLTATGSD
jgi:uncharacterized membrane protein